MRIHAEAQIWLARPVLQVVPRFLARTREIRNFILHDSRRAQPFAGALIHFRGQFIAGHKVRMVARAAGDEFASQPGIFVHFQHVNTGVRHAAANNFIQRCFPACRGLVRQSGNQVHIDIADASGAQPRHIGQSNVARVQATN